MTDNEAKELIKMLAAVYGPGARFSNDTEGGKPRRELYIKHLLNYDFQTARNVMEKLVGYHKFCPTLSEIKEAYEIETKHQAYQDASTPKKDNCKICHGLGYVLERRIENELPYEFMLHCECVAADKWRYDGSQCKDHKSKHYIKSVALRDKREIQMQPAPARGRMTVNPAKGMISALVDKMIPEPQGRPKLAAAEAEKFYL